MSDLTPAPIVDSSRIKAQQLQLTHCMNSEIIQGALQLQGIVVCLGLVK